MPRQYFFWKYFNTIIVLYCIIVQKSPIFVQLSPIQCTYSNIFIRFFKFFPANTTIYQNSYRVPGANCAVEIALSGRQCSLLCLFAPFPHASTKVSCVGLTRCPFREILTSLCSSEWQKKTKRLLYSSLQYSSLISFRTKYFMSLRGIANGDAVAISRKGNLVIKPKTINANLSAFTNFRTWSTPLFINISLFNPSLYMIARVSFWQFYK